MKEESEKVGLKLNIQKTKIMVSGPITSWEIDGETIWGNYIDGETISGPITSWEIDGEIDGETKVSDFIFGAPKSL